VESNSVRNHTKSDDRAAEVRFVNHKYDYRLNWTTQCPVTNNQNYGEIREASKASIER